MKPCRFLVFAIIVLFPATAAWAHPDKVEDRLLFHFATGTHPPADGLWPDLTHHVTARLMGSPVYTNLGPAQVLVLNGFDDWLLVADSRTAAEPVLPSRELSIAAWVLLQDTGPNGGIAGFIQDNGDFEKGWLLGYKGQNFVFRLASRGADDGNGELSTIRARTAIVPGQWHHVVGTYDGSAMRLYVNGRLEAQGTNQSGEILYPESGRYAIGAYVDDDQLLPLEGALYEVKSYSRVLSESEVAETVRQNQALLDYRPAVNTLLQFVVAPYLQFATRDRITVMCETTRPSGMVVEYAERQPFRQSASTTGPATIHSVTLTGLKPHATYFYRVTCTDAEGNTARSEVHSFQTAPGPSDSWAFGILGDTQRNPEITRRCAEGIFALRPHFLLHCGDVVDDGFAKHQWVKDLFEPCSPLFANIPVFPVIGNHEKNAHWYYDYFSLPEPEYHYTFHYGNAQFFMIDSNKDCRPGSPQYRWLERELARSRATWKFACHHHPCFSSDEDDYGDRWKGKGAEPFNSGDANARHLVPLYEKYGVDIAFAGHIHSYERTWPILGLTINQKKGVRYIVSGGGGGGLEQAGPQRSWFTLHVQRGHHYAFATVHDRTIQFKAYDVEGRLFDTFELTRTGRR